MHESLSRHRNALVRQVARRSLSVPHGLALGRHRRSPTVGGIPPILANAFPKSGTHLLDQVLRAVPGSCDYGRFLASLTSSRSFKPRGAGSIARALDRSLPGEVLRAHLHHDRDLASQLRGRGFVTAFVHRDLRDVAISEAHYLRDANRWHRLHRHFARLDLDAAIALAIKGLPAHVEPNYPDIAARWGLYAGWMHEPGVITVRFESLVSHPERATRDLAGQLVALLPSLPPVEELAARMWAAIRPAASHTFRSGRAGGWRSELSERNGRIFEEVAGPLLVELGYAGDQASP